MTVVRDPQRLLFVGPMLGRNEGWVTTQGEVLADLFRREGWEVRETSSVVGRLGRLADTLAAIWRWRTRTDVVVLSVFSGPAFAMADVSSALARRLGLPVVMVLHGGLLPEFGERHPRWVGRVLARACELVAPSPYLARGEWLGGRAPVVIPNVVDAEGIPSRLHAPAAPSLLWMRTFHPLYNPSMAVRAFARIQVRYPEATLTMAGQEKGSLDQVRAEVTAAGLTAAVRFAGFLDADAKGRALEDHDIYLHTNHVDNTPVSVIEAALAGLPIVATSVGGIPDLLTDGETALLVDDDDDAAMARAVHRILEEPALADLLSRAGRSLDETYGWAAVRDRWIPLLVRCAGSAHD